MPRRTHTSAALLREAFGEGVFSTADAARLGVSTRSLASVTKAGHLRRLSRDRYILARRENIDEEPWEASRQEYLARLNAAMHGRAELAAAGVSAAAVLGLPCPQTWGDWNQLPIVLAGPRPQRWREGRRRLTLTGAVVTTTAGVLCTDLLTTAVDVARHLDMPEALIVVDSIARRVVADQSRHILALEATRTEVRRELLDFAEVRLGGAPGIARARWVLSAADPAADSPPESYIRGHIIEAGLPEPEVNPRLVGLSGRTYYPDLLYRRQSLLVEIDGRLKYGGEREVLYREKMREDDLRAAGWQPLRWPAADVFAAPQLLVADLRAALAARSLTG